LAPESAKPAPASAAQKLQARPARLEALDAAFAEPAAELPEPAVLAALRPPELPAWAARSVWQDAV
jgi:hypothetical protein